VVFADALGVPEADRAEALALADALGTHGGASPSRRPRPAFGRAYCAAPVLDVAAAVLAMEHGMIPPTPNVFDICHDLDLVVTRARAAEPRTALVLSRGLMGSNSALVLRLGADDASVARSPAPPAHHPPHKETHHMSDRITVEELSELMKKSAGVTVTPEELQERYDVRLRRPRHRLARLLGIVGELENRYGTPMPTRHGEEQEPAEFLELVNSALLAGA
jgi:hypothetical protein